MWSAEAESLCRTLGITYPIIQAPMAGGPTTGALVAAVSDAGGLGSIGAGYMTPDALRASIREVRGRTRQPFAVNLFARSNGEEPHGAGPEAREQLLKIAADVGLTEINFEPDVPDYLDDQVAVVHEEGVPIVSTTFGILAPHHLELLRDRGTAIIGTATCVAEARAAQDAGCIAVAAQGFEAGGHRGSFLKPERPPLVGLMALLPQVVDAVRLPVIASGGIMNGRGIAASLVLGAAAVQMGTAFLTTAESGADEVWKLEVLQSDETSTTLTRAFSGKSARGIRNSFVKRMEPYEADVASYPMENQVTAPIRAAARRKSEPDFMSLWCGQGSPLSRRLSANELVHLLVEEVNECLRQVHAA